MPFENSGPAPRRIAVIGGGISGMAAAHFLARRHNVVLIEAEGRLGGHARTLVAGKNGDQPVDTGFIVFNRANYPHLTSLFEKLEVPIAESEMTFAASVRRGRTEYGLKDASTIFGQRSNLLHPKYLRMMRDILHFNKNAERMADDPDLTVEELLQRLGTGRWFRDYYLAPLSGAIWSSPVGRMLDFPAHALVRFFLNHALMGYYGQHQWLTVRGGSRQYVARLEQSLLRQGVDLRLGRPIRAIRRTPYGAEVRDAAGEWEAFDELVLATHSDTSLALLSDPTPQERTQLGAITFQPNEAVLHADPIVMPKRCKLWSSWNYREGPDGPAERIDLTYWMNSLQPIPQDDPMFVTLNSAIPIRDELIYDTTTFRHPVFTHAALRAQEALVANNGRNHTWYCGAWMRNGFHEDGIASAVRVAEAIDAIDILRVAAE